MHDVCEHFSLAKASRQFSIDGNAVSPSTVFRWMKDGVKVRGRRVRLGAIRLGRRLTTTTDLIEKFRQELAEAEAAPRLDDDIPECQPVAPMKPASPAKRQREVRRANEELAARGY